MDRHLILERNPISSDPATRIARDLKAADLDNMTPIQALDLLRKLRGEL